jgi:PTH1 family peptidyl-tRNA hydrolase
MARPEDKDALALVVGLGNPGEPYRGTRHNIGFEVVDRLAAAVRGSGELVVAGGRLEKGRLKGRAVLLLWPLLYMNRSGRPTAEVARRFELPPARILAVSDDLDLELGRIRLRRGGSSGGHNGVADLIAELGTDAFHRLRLGIGRPSGEKPAERYVLEPFLAEERPVAEEMAARGAEAARCWLLEGVQSAMNRYNAPSLGEGGESELPAKG